MFHKRGAVSVIVLLTVFLSLMGCGEATPEVVEKVVTQVVKETVVVESTAEVIEKEVTRVVEVEKVVTPEPIGECTYGGTAVVAIAVDPGDFQPLTNTDDFVHLISVNLFSKLTKFAPDWSVAPDLAESWDISEDGKTYTFHLREGVTFHDGTPCTSADVKYSMEYFTTKGGMAASYTMVESVEAPDDYTVIVNLSEPNAPFLHNLAWAASMIMPKHLYEGTELETNAYNKEPVGTGPFKFVEWVPDDHITLEANEDYFGGRPYLDRLIFKFIPENETAIAAFDAGEVDALSYGSTISFADYPAYLERDDAHVKANPLANWFRVALNTKIDKFSDVRVRQAIAHAIDTEKIVNAAFSGVPPAATNANPIPPILEWAYTDEAAAYPYDPEKAEALLDEAGFPRGDDGIRFETNAQYAVWLPGTDEWWLLMQEMLRDVGIEMDLQRIDPATWQEKVVYKHEFEVTMAGGSITDPDMLRLQYHSQGTDNSMGYENPDVDRLLEEGSKESDPDKRAEYYHEVGKIIAEDVPSIPILMPVVIHVWNSQFGGQFLEWYWFDQSQVCMVE